MDRWYIWRALRALFSPSYLKYRIERFGYDLHESVVWRQKMRAGKNIRVHPSASIRYPENIEIGDNSHINLGCCIWAGEKKKIILGKDLLMGPYVQIHCGHHSTKLGEPMMWQPGNEADIVIGDDVWLCGGVVVTSGVKIADGVIVAANAVVTKDILEANAIAGGVPAKVIARRK